MRMIGVSGAAITVALVAAFAGVIPAAGEDAVMGSGMLSRGDTFAISARSGPLGEDPTGVLAFTLTVPGFGAGHITATVTCLAVALNLAAVGAEVVQSTLPPFPEGTELVFSIRDSGLRGGEGDGFEGVEAPAATCPAFLATAANAPTIEQGNLRVHDDPAP